MPITIQIRSEDGQRLHQGGIYVQSPESCNRQAYPLLSGIDPYGDTIFNRGQCEHLIEEVDALLAVTNREDAGSLLEIRSLWPDRLRTPHTYLWFVGD